VLVVVVHTDSTTASIAWAAAQRTASLLSTIHLLSTLKRTTGVNDMLARVLCEELL
jgi:hypothetical protein